MRTCCDSIDRPYHFCHYCLSVGTLPPVGIILCLESVEKLTVEVVCETTCVTKEMQNLFISAIYFCAALCKYFPVIDKSHSHKLISRALQNVLGE